MFPPSHADVHARTSPFGQGSGVTCVIATLGVGFVGVVVLGGVVTLAPPQATAKTTKNGNARMVYPVW
jgi:hypothetical protein